MKSPLAVLLGAALVAAPFVPVRSADATLPGYAPAASAQQRAFEARFDAAVKPLEMKAWMRRLTARPHHLGSPYDADNARWLAAQFTAFGWDAHVERFTALFPTPVRRVVDLVTPPRYHATLQEPAVAQDATTAMRSEALPTYNAYARDGDVTAPLVYVNYGLPPDYDELARHGISVRGKIVIARYGASWRGIKPKLAAQHGAIGTLIYSDPRDDGYATGPEYPAGTARAPRSAQRGSVEDLPVQPGDPSRPPSGTDGTHLPPAKIAVLDPIPTLPISWSDALPLLRALDGPTVPAAWRGALPITYRFGGSNAARVHLVLAQNWRIVPVYDVVARMRGSTFPDEWIVRGNHHDAWVTGAADPISGAVTVMEEARVLGDLARTGWKPKRTLVYCLWDGEEPGLIGSTAWAETHQAELRAHAIAYVNSDGNGRGFLGADGSHSLERLVSGVADDVRDPERRVSVKERVLARNGVARALGQTGETEWHLGALGSGSDYTSFVDHVGVPSLNIGYGGEDNGAGSYHSIYDDFDEYTRLKDTTFAFGAALAETGGRITTRLADADAVPYAFLPVAEAVNRYLDEIEKAFKDDKAATARWNALVAKNAFVVAADPREPLVAPTARPAVPDVDFAPVENALTRVAESAKAYDAAYDAAVARGIDPATSAKLTAALIAAEHALVDDAGLPRRPWFRHQLYAPGYFTGYGVKTLPYVREALEARNYPEARTGIERLARILGGYAEKIDAAATVVRSGQASPPPA